MAEQGPWTASWRKILSTFKVALDLRKLLLAAAGILATAAGWYVLSVLFYSLVSRPEWKDVDANVDEKQRGELWRSFQARRASWNLLYELAGPADDTRVAVVSAADVPLPWQAYEILAEIEQAHRRARELVRVNELANQITLVEADREGRSFPISVESADVDKLAKRTATVGSIQTTKADDTFLLSGVSFKVTKNVDDFRKYVTVAESDEQLRRKLEAVDAKRREFAPEATRVYKNVIVKDERRAGGRLRAWPWFEHRGPNQFLMLSSLVARTDHATADPVTLPWVPGQFLGWLLTEEVPVLLEPLAKLLTPIIYLAHPAADWYVKIYLILVLLWFLAVWGFVGGALSRMAAVQLARSERIGIRGALTFAKDRFVSYFAAPAFPIALLAILVVVLVIFGWLGGLIPVVGDIVIFGLLWPVALVFGLIMAVVLVGLVGWPLMNATISTEGSDAFDALSRSYSYVYQAPWHYLWYTFLSVVYGAVLVFFVGLMASLVVYLGKWGVSQTPGLRSNDPAKDREPSFLFVDAPTSFQWRDLLIRDSDFALVDRRALPPRYTLHPDYVQSLTWYNKAGAFLVSVWIYLFFLLVLGFGYSYFWTASTMIYLLMRRHVDDTELDEVHLETPEDADLFTRPAPAAPAPAAEKPNTVSLNVVDAPRNPGGATTPPGATGVPPAATTPPGSPGVQPAATTPPSSAGVSPAATTPPGGAGVPPAATTPPGGTEVPPATTSPTEGPKPDEGNTGNP